MVGRTLGNLGKKVFIDLAVLLAKNFLPRLATKAISSVLDKFERKISGRRDEEQEKDSLYSLRLKIFVILLKS